MKRLIAVIAACLAMTGCATNYGTYAKAQAEIATAQSAAETARLVALARIAESGDAGAKIGAVFALAFSGQRQSTQLQAPVDPFMEWARILVPGVTQLYGIQKNTQVQLRQIDAEASKYGATLDAITGVANKGIDAAAKDPVIVEPFVVEVPTTP